MGGGRSGHVRQLIHDIRGLVGCSWGSTEICTCIPTPMPTAQQLWELTWALVCAAASSCAICSWQWTAGWVSAPTAECESTTAQTLPAISWNKKAKIRDQSVRFMNQSYDQKIWLWITLIHEFFLWRGMWFFTFNCINILKLRLFKINLRNQSKCLFPYVPA